MEVHTCDSGTLQEYSQSLLAARIQPNYKTENFHSKNEDLELGGEGDAELY